MSEEQVAACGRIVEFDAGDLECWMLLGAILPTWLATDSTLSHETDLLGENGEFVTGTIYKVDLGSNQGICQDKLSDTFFIDTRNWICGSKDLATLYHQEVKRTGASLPASFLLQICCFMVSNGGV